MTVKDWLAAATAELEALEEVRILRRTAALGYYDQNMVALCQHEDGRGPGVPRQRLHHLRARQVVLASGAIERPLVFANNDRPGHMLASAARTYVNRFAARPGTRAVLFTNNDGAYQAAAEVAAGGLQLAAVIDLRGEIDPKLADDMRRWGAQVLPGHAITDTFGANRLWGIEARALFTQGPAVVEDPATGSACSNLGAWLVAQGRTGVSWRISQGAQVGRPSTLDLSVSEEGVVQVGGLVVEVGDDTMYISVVVLYPSATKEPNTGKYRLVAINGRKSEILHAQHVAKEEADEGFYVDLVFKTDTEFDFAELTCGASSILERVALN